MGAQISHIIAAGSGAAWIALLAAFAWGILGVLLSPCHLAVIPLVVGIVSGQAKSGTPRAFATAAFLALGTLVSFTGLGVVVAATGTLMAEAIWFERALAIVLIVIGLNLIGLLHLPHLHVHMHARGKGLPAAFVLGLLYGCAHGPCCLAFMAPVITVALGSASAGALYAAGLLIAFGLGHSSVMLLTGTAAGTFQRYFTWGVNKRVIRALCGVSGVLVVLAGAYMLVEPLLAVGK